MEYPKPTKRALTFGFKVSFFLAVGFNILLLLVAHICQGASTQVGGTAPFNLLKPHTASNDNLFSAIGRLAKAHAWFMMVVVALLSGLWPYLKLLGTLTVLLSYDNGSLSLHSTRKALSTLEVLGKYSFADVFLICFDYVIFDIRTGRHAILQLGHLQVEIWMQAKLAVAALISAVTLSAFLTHVAVSVVNTHIAVEAEEEPRPELEPLLGPRHVRWALDEEMQKAKPLSFAKRFCSILLPLLTSALLVMASWKPFLRMDRGGFLGKLIRPMEDQSLQLSPALVTARMTSLSSSRIDALYVAYTVGFFVLLTMIAPVLELLCLSAANVAACCGVGRRAKWLKVCAAWLNSFDCVDVLLIVALATLLDMKTVVDFNLGSECAPFQTIMSSRSLLTLAGLGFAASSSCFEPVSSLLPGFWLLLLCVLLRSLSWRLHEGLWKAQLATKDH